MIDLGWEFPSAIFLQIMPGSKDAARTPPIIATLKNQLTDIPY
jgi:hypothetical protein